MKFKRISRRSFLKLVAFTTGGAVVSIKGIFEYASHIEPKWLKVERVVVRLANLPRAFEDVKIAQISDFHADVSITSEDVA